MDMIPVKSSNLKTVGYDERNKILEIEFHDGGRIYQYFDVPKDIFEELLNAPSLGKFHHRNIKKQFEYKRIK